MTRPSARLLALALALLPVPIAAETMAEVFPDQVEWLEPGYQDRFAKLELQRGTIDVPGGIYQLDLGPEYCALTGSDAAWVFEALWDNLPDPDVAALVFQSGTSPVDDSWAVAVSYYAEGHISDDEADRMDYEAIVQSRREAEPEANRQRREAGLPELMTIGLAGTPGYDKTARALHFSVLLNSPSYEGELLNANAWVLSRHGFVLLNVIGDASHAAAADEAMPNLVRLVSFSEGNRYEDFIPGVDTVAEGGLNALLGGGAQLTLVALGIALLKKFGFLLAVPLVWLANAFRRRSS